MAGTPSTGATRRAAALCGLGAVMAVALATPSAAAPMTRPHPGGGDSGEAAGRGGKGSEGAGPGNSGAEAAGPAPKLSIGIDDGRTAAKEGDRLTYAVTVHNIGTTDARRLRLTQSMPPGLKFVSADGHGTAKGGQVVWTVDLPAGRDVTFHTTAQVGATPDELLRLASIACASARGEDRPIVCATHSDQLPAGAAAAEATRQAASPAPARPWYLPAGAVLLLLAVSGVWAFRRGRFPFRPRQPS